MRDARGKLLLGLLLLAVAGIPAGAAPAPAATTASSLAAVAAPLYRQLAQMRGLASPGAPPSIVVQSREETRRFIEQELDRRYSPTRIEQERKSLIAWGLIPPDYDLRRLFVDLMDEQIAAYYDPRAKVMVVGDWLAPEQQQIALTHELVHALQDREVSLEEFIAPRSGQGDQLLARQALMEGEAVALTLEIGLKAQGMDLASVADTDALPGTSSPGRAGPVIDSAPKFLRDLLLFPYVQGLRFVHQLRKRQPWSTIRALYRDPPRSTAQIINPDKCLTAREDPLRIALPDLGPLGPTVRLIADDELGEFALGAVLGRHVGERVGRAAASGWRGDRYRIWEDGEGRFMIAYLVALESERGAESLARWYARALERRHRTVAGKGAVRTGDLATWRDGNRAFAVETRGAEVLALEQMPSGLIDSLREAIWRARPKS
jgi:hypothetical protein